MKKIFLTTIFFSIVFIGVFAGFDLLQKKDIQNLMLNEQKQEFSSAENYKKYCAGCHGDNLEKFDKKNWMFGNSDEMIVNSITNGDLSIGMPAFKATFTENEIIALAKYVKTKVPIPDVKQVTKSSAVIVSEQQRFTVDTIVTGLDVPWGMEVLPNGELLIAERSGKLLKYNGSNLLDTIIGLPPIFVKGQGGLLDIKLHPKYQENGWIYIAYSDIAEKTGEKGGNTSIIRAKLKGNTLIDIEKIFNGIPDTDKAYHFGCKLEFDKNGFLFFGIGDRGEQFTNPQSIKNSNGKIHRIHDDGRIPSDNPFVNTPEAQKSIYSYGHRNPQGTAMHPQTGEIWVSEHGPMGGDELNLIKPGRNYGWPIISYGINYDGTKFTEIDEKEGMEQPIFYWLPSIAPCGMVFITSDKYPKWKSNIFIGSLRFKYVERLVVKENRVLHREKLLDNVGRVRNVVVGSDGFIYVAIEQPGKILRINPLP